MPYRSRLTEPFEPGQTLIVKGKTAEDSVRYGKTIIHVSMGIDVHDVELIEAGYCTCKRGGYY